MAKGRRATKSLHPRPKAKSKKTPLNNEANRAVQVTLRMQHRINGVAYGPGVVRVSKSLADDMLHTEGHAVEVEEQFRGAKAAIIGARRGASGHTVREVPTETFDDEYGKASPADVVKGSLYGNDTGSGRPV